MKPHCHHVIAIALMLLCQAHAEEAPRKFATLATKKKTYENVTIREVSPSGVKIMHDSGTATIPYTDLSEAIQKQLGGFDPALAKEHRQKEDEALAAQEQALDKELGKMAEREASKKVAPIPFEELPFFKDPSVSKAPSGFQFPEAPVSEGTPLADFFPSEPMASAPQPVSQPPVAAAPPKAEVVKKQVKGKGDLAARIVGYRSGSKDVEFRVLANCDTRLEISQVTPGQQSIFLIPKNTEFLEVVSVYNNYSGTLTNDNGDILDKESHDRKTNVGGLAIPKL